MDTNLSRAGGYRQSLPPAPTSNTATSGTGQARALSQQKRMGAYAVKQGDGRAPMAAVSRPARKKSNFVGLAEAESIAIRAALAAAAETQRAVDISLSDMLKAQHMNGSAPHATNGLSSAPRTPPAPPAPPATPPARLKARPAPMADIVPVTPPAGGSTAPPSAQIATPATPGPVLMPKLDLAKAFPGQPPGTTPADPKPALTPAIKRPKLVRSKAKTNGLVQKKPSPRVAATPGNAAPVAKATNQSATPANARNSLQLAPEPKRDAGQPSIYNILTALSNLADQIAAIAAEHAAMKLDTPLRFHVLDQLGPQHPMAASPSFMKVVDILLENTKADQGEYDLISPLSFLDLQALFSEKQLKALGQALAQASAGTNTRS